MVVYSSFYNFQREPFSLSPDPGFLYMAPTHREAIAQLTYTVQARKGLAVLTGEVGTGKTTLMRNLLESVGDDVRTAYLLNPPRSRTELFAALASEFELAPAAPEEWNLLLQRFLLDSFRNGKTVVALFDEAQEIPREILEEIRLLSNLETSNTKLLQIILAGQPELDAILDSNELRALRQRIALRYSLSALAPEETVQYILLRLKRAGADRSPFDMQACRAIHKYAAGIPRLINQLCDQCLLSGYVANRRVVDAQRVRSVVVAARLDVTRTGAGRATPAGRPTQSATPRSWGTIGAVTAIALLAVSFALLYGIYPSQVGAFVARVHSIVGRVVSHGTPAEDDSAAAAAGQRERRIEVSSNLIAAGVLKQ